MFAQATDSKQNDTSASSAGFAEEGRTTEFAGKTAAGNQTMLRRQAAGLIAYAPARPSQTMQPQSRPTVSHSGTAAPQSVHNVVRSGGQPLEPQTRDFMESRFGRDLSQVRIHTDSRAADSARAVNAEAYAVGQHIAFGPGSYMPSTPKGQHLLAHELAHTLQQNQGSETVRRRRVPDQADIDAIMPAAGPDYAVHLAGLLRLVRNAWNEIPVPQQTLVLDEANKFGITRAPDDLLFSELATATRDQVMKFIVEVQKVDPTITLGDPTKIDSTPRPATADVANIAKVVTEADKVFDAVSSGAENKDIGEVFGTTNIWKATVKFGNAKKAMHDLQAANKIVTDRSGYNKEAHLGGLSNSDQISVKPEIIDNPTLPDSVEGMVHESMHAGNSDVRDKGYVKDTAFTKMSEDDKLNNAADYEVIANRMLSPASPYAFVGIPFVPPGTKVGGVTEPKLPQKQEAMHLASEDYRRAWTIALNLHVLFVREFKQPAEWSTLNLGPDFGVTAHFSDSLPFWSKVENMTIHKRMSINPTGGAQSTAPVTEIDVAQSESVVHKLSEGMQALKADKFSEADAAALEQKANANQAAAIAKGAAQEGKVLVSLIRSEKTGEITGTVERDERVIDVLSKANQAANPLVEILTPKKPASFKD